MRRQFSAKGLQVLRETVADRRQLVRRIYAAYQTKLSELETRKKDYSPEFFTRQQGRLKEDALAALQIAGEEIVKLVEPALQERQVHSRAAYLASLRFPEEEVEPIDKSKEGRALQIALETRNAVAQLAAVNRLQRLSDDGLLAATQRAVAACDYTVLAVALEESTLRAGLVQLKIKEVIDAIEIPQAKGAEETFALLEETVAEVRARGQLVLDPKDNAAHVVLRSQEINEEAMVKRVEEKHKQETAKNAAREAQEQARKVAAEKFISELPPAAA